jgi:hypothetical protein
MSFKPEELAHNIPGTVEQIAGMIVLVAIILSALKSQSK